MRQLLYIIMFSIFFISCKENEADKIQKIVEEWNGRTIIFPTNVVFFKKNGDSVHDFLQPTYKILHYVDSTGCMSCKLQLLKWKQLIHEMSVQNIPVQFVFVFSTQEEESIYSALCANEFDYPVCIDKTDSLNVLNHFPVHSDIHTFLLDSNNCVLALGNPVQNLNVKDLYVDLMSGAKGRLRKKSAPNFTEVVISKKTIVLDDFDWTKKQSTAFILKNVGSGRLVIHDVITSCGCTIVDYDKAPVSSGDSLFLYVSYKSSHPGYFSKTITVVCNAKDSPIKLRVSGMAK